jgi:hypothetical protein
MHRVRTVSAGGKVYCRCIDSNETAVADNVLSAYHALNKLCGHKHRALYEAEAAQRKAEEVRFMRVRPNKMTRRETVSQLNDRVNRRW